MYTRNDMNRTAHLLRRTLLCAVFACPLAAACFPCALALMASAALAASGTAFRAPWYTGNRGGGARRAIPPLIAGLTLAAALRKGCALLLPAGLAAWYLPLCALSGLLAQAALLLNAKKTGRRRILACLPLLLLFSVCMR